MSDTFRGDEPLKAHHVWAHATGTERYFRDDLDCARFLTILSEEIAKTDVVCLAYSLVVNHFHLILVSGSRWGLSRFMKRVLGRYAQYYNRRHGRIGHLRRRPFGSTPIDDDAKLVTEIRYVLLNRVMARLVPDLDALEVDAWTSYGIAMRGRPVNVVDEERILSIFGATADEARENLRRFCQAGLERRDWFEEMTRILEATHRYKLRREAIRKVLPDHADLQTDLDRISSVVCARAGLSAAGIVGGRAANPQVARARGAIAHFGRRLLAATGSDLATFLGISPSGARKSLGRGELDARALSLDVDEVVMLLSAQSPTGQVPHP